MTPLQRGIRLSSLVFCKSVAFCLLSFLSIGVSAQEPLVPNNKNERIALFRESVDKILNQLDKKQGPGVAVWVEVDGEVVYSKWAGLAQREMRIPIDGNTTFELASASKPLTAALVLQLAESGLLQLDDAAIKWLPELPPVWGAITIRNLLNQTAGIPDYMSQINSTKLLGLDGLTNQQLLKRWETGHRLNFNPGTQVEYSNSNYVLLAEIASSACGTGFGQCLRQRIFEPLGMNGTRVESEESSQGEVLALNYALSKKTKGILLKTEGPTGIYSSLNDIALWLQAYQAGKIVSKAGTTLMTTPVFLSPVFDSGERYGMGWVLPPEDNKISSYTHAGQKDGYRTLISANTTNHVNYIILSNGGDFVQPISTEIKYWIQEIFEAPP
jgi:CubicO group peptidase (beta-lactamase class C family)